MSSELSDLTGKKSGLRLRPVGPRKQRVAEVIQARTFFDVNLVKKNLLRSASVRLDVFRP
jgi:hypothetical protein